MATLTVGPDGEFSTIGAAIAASENGDVIQVQGGTYINDFAKITDSITLEGVGGRVDMVATRPPLNRKGIFIVGDAANAPNVTINGFDFEGAKISAGAGGNGAGIRYQSGNLTLDNDLFVNNQDGLLATPFVAGEGSITIDHSEFGDNGSGTGFTHNLYVGMIGSLTVANSYFHDVSAGHEIKSRAAVNTIENSRILDINGTASYSIDLPNGSRDVVEGNVIEKGLHSVTNKLIEYYVATGSGVPQIGSDRGHWPDSQLTVTGNTLLSDLAAPKNAIAIWNTSTIPVALSNNGFFNILPVNVVLGPSAISGSTFLAMEPVLDTSDPFLACYVRGTMIRTTDGELPVEKLRPGKQVITRVDGEEAPQTVTWLGHRRIGLAGHPRPETVAPIRIRRDAFADGMPHRDLVVSPDHAIFVDGKLICARQLVNGTTIRQELDWTAVDYYHVELDRHAILLAEGLPAESYIDTGNSGFFANSGAPLVLHPDLTDQTDYPTREAGSCAPFVWDEASVRPVWLKLADRAATIGRPVTQSVTTTDADLRLLADRRPVKPVFSDNDRVIFVLPGGAGEVRLVSRAQSPTEARPWLEDRRRLGVRVKRIVLRSAEELRDIPLDHPDLTRGWWGAERDAQIMSRWTDGEAVLPLPPMRGAAVLEIQLAGSMIYVMDAVPAGWTEAARFLKRQL